jgi:Ser/Thr protein kinase RdoA (MazF antagonist)
LPAAVRSDRALRSAARAVRALHDAGEGFVPPQPGAWGHQEVTAAVEINCVGHGDLAPSNLLFDDDQVVGIIDFDFAGPSNRAYDLSYLAHQMIPLHPTEHLEGFGFSLDDHYQWARRLRILAAAYGPDMRTDQLVDFAAVRLLSTAVHIDQQIRAGSPAFAVHRRDDFAAGYRAAAGFILTNRSRLLG